MSDYNKLKVQDLHDLLKERSLPVSGKKSDLITRLQDHDSKAASTKSTAPPAAAPTSTLPAEDEIDWLEEDTTTTTPAAAASAPAKPTNPAPAPASASASAPTSVSATAKKATTSSAAAALAAGGQGQVSNPTAVPNQKIDTDPSKTSDLTIKGDATLPSEKPTQVIAASGEATKPADPKPAKVKATEATAAPASDPTTGPAKLDIKSELEKRKERARKFGTTEKSSEEAAKLLERQKRFGTESTAEQKAGSALSKLDQPLPERDARKRGRGGDGEDGGRERGGKRRRGQDRQRGGPNREQGNRRGERQRTGAGGDGAAKPAIVSEADRKKAEARKARFATESKWSVT